MENWGFWLILVIIFIPISFIFIATPYLTRRTESFGISVTEEVYWHPDIRGMRRNYAIVLAIFHILLLIAAASFMNLSDEKQMSLAIGGYTFAVIGVSFAVYLFFHFKMKKMKREQGWMSPVIQSAIVDTSFRRRKLSVSSYWFIPHILLSFGTLAAVLLFYDQFPDQLVMQYDFAGNATRVVDKSYSSLLWPIGTQFIMIAVFLLINYSIVISKQQIDAADPEASVQRNTKFRHSWSVFLVATGFLTTLLFSFITILPILDLPQSSLIIVATAIPVIIVIGSIWLSVRLGQGGSRIRMPGGTASGIGTGPTDDDRYWKLGGIYYNPSDPALFLEKRFGIGWTINYGHPLAWLICIILVAVIVISILLGK